MNTIHDIQGGRGGRPLNYFERSLDKLILIQYDLDCGLQDRLPLYFDSVSYFDDWMILQSPSSLAVYVLASNVSQAIAAIESQHLCKDKHSCPSYPFRLLREDAAIFMFRTICTIGIDCLTTNIVCIRNQSESSLSRLVDIIKLTVNERESDSVDDSPEYFLEQLKKSERDFFVMQFTNKMMKGWEPIRQKQLERFAQSSKANEIDIAKIEQFSQQLIENILLQPSRIMVEASDDTTATAQAIMFFEVFMPAKSQSKTSRTTTLQ